MARVGPIRNSVNLVLKFFGKIIGFDSGVFTLTHGKHEVEIESYVEPACVWTRVTSNIQEGCGQFPVDKISTFLVGNNKIRFIIDVESESAQISWFAIV